MKKFLSIFISVLFLMSFSSCKNDKDLQNNETKASETTQGYTYVTRELGEPVCIKSANKFAGGSGTEQSPYQISNASELQLLTEIFSNEDKYSSYEKSYFVLTEDIQLNETKDFSEWNENAPEYSWIPIGNTGKSFNGVFDGNNHTISGLYVNADCKKQSNEYQNCGLFAYLKGEVKNLTIDKSYFCVSGYKTNLGGICGEAFNAKITNCNSTADFYCYDAECGGIVGNSLSLSNIENCIFSGNITQIKEKSLNNLGGICGSGEADIKNCENKGTVIFGKSNADSIGGIIARINEGIIENCTNYGKLKCNESSSDKENSSTTSGGIAATAFLSNIGYKNKSKGITIKNCNNTGEINGAYYAGGIIGNASNDNSEYSLDVINCQNSGNVICDDILGGIIGKVSSYGTKISVDTCVNTADLSKGKCAGIIGQIGGGPTITKGILSVTNCKNKGNISSSDQYCAGIIRYILLSNDVDMQLTVDKCINEGKIYTQNNAGGIIAFCEAGELVNSVSDNTNVKLTNCKNTGEIVTVSNTGFIGGIAGNIGLKNIKTNISNCKNSGNLTVNSSKLSKEEIEETQNSKVKMSLTRICGGIVGRIGSGLLLTTDSDEKNNDNINKKDAVIIIDNCASSGKFSVPDENEYLYKDGKPIYTNEIGGIIGNCCGTEDFSVNVTNCTYSNASRGMGIKSLKDVGNKQ